MMTSISRILLKVVVVAAVVAAVALVVDHSGGLRTTGLTLTASIALSTILDGRLIAPISNVVDGDHLGVVEKREQVVAIRSTPKTCKSSKPS